MELQKYTFGIGDRFAHQGKAQLEAIKKAKEELSIDIIPVWNKSNREHSIIHTIPEDTRKASDDAVSLSKYSGPYYCDADHINMSNVDKFINSCDFFTIDVAEYIGKASSQKEVEIFIENNRKYIGNLKISGIPVSFVVTEDYLKEHASKYLSSIGKAGEIYKYIESKKGKYNFVTEISMDEVNDPQTPLDLFFILSSVAHIAIPIQTIAPRFTGRFNKGVDYVGNKDLFATEFENDIHIIDFAIKEFKLPSNLKLSVHSGSDKFSIYPLIGQIIKKYNKGIHIKTAGTTWLEEVIGLALGTDESLDLVKAIYGIALTRFDELCKPYESVIDINRDNLPSSIDILRWTGEQFAFAIRHIPNHPDYNPDMRQLMHVAYKVAVEYGEVFLDELKNNEEIISKQVVENLFERHIKRIFDWS